MASDFNSKLQMHNMQLLHMQKMRQNSTNFCEIKLMNFWEGKIDKTKKKNGQYEVCAGMLFSSDYASLLFSHNRSKMAVIITESC